ncbi:MAG: GMC oxidoreductase [Bacteroidales bacterium]|nr:GMC oxidoreductase [Bacteroidales bacterium]MCF6341583.1 GMC oxidoreductase [Bacteroidales bacterium]
MTENYDYVIIGSGFGGSVSALRLCEKGYKVLLVEKGKWYGKDDFPETNWNLKKWLWLPSLRFFGIMKMTFFRHVSIISGVGVGGGSLVYANTLPTPKPAFYNTGSWKGLENWEAVLKPHYATALRMLGATPNPHLELGDNLLQQLASQQGRGGHFEAARVSVFFGEAEKTVPDPYFNGEGPARSGCNICGACMTGCRHNAKNSLDKNYLHLARNKGLEIIAENEVLGVKPRGSQDGSEGYTVTFRNATSFFNKRKTTVRTKGVVFAGGVLGTVKLLLKLKKTSLPRLSKRVGDDVRTNNESLIFSITPDKEKDLTKGIAIGSVYHADENSHLEPVRYGQGSGFWRLMMVPVVSGGSFFSRMFQITGKILRHPIVYFRLFTVKDFARQSIVLLFMQHLDSTLVFRRGFFRMKTKVSKGSRPKAQIPLAARLAEKYGELTGGKSFVILTESVLNMPSTAHILGGAVMGKSEAEGVIDKNNRVFGYKNMLVCDGSMVSANPGVNPSLTITALAERAMEKIAEKD